MVFDLVGAVSPPWPLQVRVRRLLNSAYMQVVADYGLIQKSADLAFTAGDPFVDLPADFLKAMSVRAGGRVLRMVSDAEWAAYEAGDVQWGASTDGPSVWVLANPSQIMVWPAPSESTSTGGVLRYVAEATEMASDSDEPSVLPETWHDLLAWIVISQVGPTDQVKAHAAGVVNLQRSSLGVHVADRGGDDSSRITLRGYPGRG